MKYFVPLLLATALSPLFVSAQMSDVQTVINSAVSLSISPSTPGANQNVTAELQSSSIDLDTSTITWKVNGKTAQSGQGEKTFSLTSGGIGSQTTVSALISESGGGSLTESITFSPGEVDLMYEGGGYLPPFYEGRALWANEGQITFFAVPHILNANGTPINPKTLIYKWIQNDTVLGDSSGAGKNSLTLNSTILSLPQAIEVDVLTNNNTTVATQSINLTPISPSLLVYEDNPLYGILFNREAGSEFDALSKEFSFVALPLFFSAYTKNSNNLSYDWEAGGSTSSRNSTVTYSVPGAGAGSAQVSVTANSSTFVTQSASRNFLVQFGNQASF